MMRELYSFYYFFKDDLDGQNPGSRNKVWLNFVSGNSPGNTEQPCAKVDLPVKDMVSSH